MASTCGAATGARSRGPTTASCVSSARAIGRCAARSRSWRRRAVGSRSAGGVGPTTRRTPCSRCSAASTRCARRSIAPGSAGHRGRRRRACAAHPNRSKRSRRRRTAPLRLRAGVVSAHERAPRRGAHRSGTAPVMWPSRTSTTVLVTRVAITFGAPIRRGPRALRASRWPRVSRREGETRAASRALPFARAHGAHPWSEAGRPERDGRRSNDERGRTREEERQSRMRSVRRVSRRALRDTIPTRSTAAGNRVRACRKLAPGEAGRDAARAAGERRRRRRLPSSPSRMLERRSSLPARGPATLLATFTSCASRVRRPRPSTRARPSSRCARRSIRRTTRMGSHVDARRRRSRARANRRRRTSAAERARPSRCAPTRPYTERIRNQA